MASPARLVGRKVRERIAASPITLTVVFPKSRPVVQSASPGPAPVRPLTGTVAPPTLVQVPLVPIRDNVVLKCLWHDADVLSIARRSSVSMDSGVWQMGATALARINPEDLPRDANQVLEDPEDFFASCDHIERGSKHYKLLRVTPAGPSDEAPYTWYLWLSGGAKQ